MSGDIELISTFSTYSSIFECWVGGEGILEAEAEGVKKADGLKL
jgi:hypothetical protein